MNAAFTEDDSDCDPEQKPIAYLVVLPCGSIHTETSADFFKPIKTTGDTEPDPDPELELETYCTPLTIHTNAFTATLWCDEDGIPKNLPVNMGIDKALSPSNPIFGTCVITGGVDDDGTMLPVPSAIVDLFGPGVTARV